MNPAELIKTLAQSGFTLFLSAEKLRCKPTPPAELLEEMRRSKAELIELLRPSPETANQGTRPEGVVCSILSSVPVSPHSMVFPASDNQGQHEKEKLPAVPPVEPKTALSAIVNTQANPPREKPLTDDEVSNALRALQKFGTLPAFFVHPVHCAKCGPVFERDWTAEEVNSCAWCYRSFKGEIARPTASDFRAWKVKTAPAIVSKAA